MKSIFTEGEAQGIMAVLESKEARVRFQKQILQKKPQAVLVDVKLNIPGPIKNNRNLTQLFEVGCKTLENDLKELQGSFSVAARWNKVTGCENFYLLEQISPYRVKEATVAFEDDFSLGRLFDADVLIAKQPEAISRRQLGLPVRRCFICQRPAKMCSRSRRHSVEDLQKFISDLYFKEVHAK